MKKCNECGQVINGEMFNQIRRKKASRLIKISKLSKEQKIFNFFELLEEMKNDLINNPEKITELVDQVVDNIQNKENE
jgi:hypothetical protein